MTVFHLVNPRGSMSSAPLYLDAVNVSPPFSNQEIAIIVVQVWADPSIPALGQHQAYQVREAAFTCQAYETSPTSPICTEGNFETLRDTVAFYNGGKRPAVPGENLLIRWHHRKI